MSYIHFLPSSFHYFKNIFYHNHTGNGEHSKYKCEICNNYYTDARFVPCCHVTYCNECIRQKSLVQNPSMIRCPSCQEVFTADVLNDAKNTKLQEKVDKLLSKLKKESSQHQIPTDTSSAINLNNPQTLTLQPPTTATQGTTINNASPNTQTVQIPHPNQSQHHQTIQIPQPVIARTNVVRPTVILQQSPPIIPPPTPLQPQVPQAIDTSRFEAPKQTFVTGDSAHYTCIECGQQGHKYKDCPKVAEKQQAAGLNPLGVKEKPPLEAASGSSSSSSGSDDGLDITNSADIVMKPIKNSSDDIQKRGSGDRKHREQKLTDLEPLGRIPKKTAAEMMPKSSGRSSGRSSGGSKHSNNNNMNLNQNLGGNNNMNTTSGYHQQQRVTPQVQLINNSTMGSNYGNLNNLNALNSLNMMNSLNMRHRLVNNVLMNAALHNATRRGGIAPRLINSNPLLNPLLNS